MPPKTLDRRSTASAGHRHRLPLRSAPLQSRCAHRRCHANDCAVPSLSNGATAPARRPKDSPAAYSSPALSSARRPLSRRRFHARRASDRSTFIKDHAERPYIGPLVYRLPFRLFRRHVCRRSEDYPAFRCPTLSRVGEFDCVAPVGAFSITFASPKSSTLTLPSGVSLMFAGFNFAMRNAFLVCRFQRLADVPGNVQRLPRPQPLHARCARLASRLLEVPAPESANPRFL